MYKPASNKVIVKSQGGFVSFRVKQTNPSAWASRKETNQGGGIRGKCTGFSSSSRTRMLAAFGKTKIDKVENESLFFTLDYGTVWPGPRRAKQHIKNFVKKLARLNPRVCASWKLEYQSRGAPHFHLVVLGLNANWINYNFVEYRDFYDYISKIWAETIGDLYLDWSREGEAPHTRVESINHWRTLIYYVSKYLGKTDKKESFMLPCPVIVRQAAEAFAKLYGGSSVDFELSYTEELLVGFDGKTKKIESSFGFTYVTYRAVVESEILENQGRFWGFLFKSRWPEGEIEQFELPYGAWFEYCKAIWSLKFRLSYRNGTGFSVFTQNTKFWTDQIKSEQAKCA